MAVKIKFDHQQAANDLLKRFDRVKHSKRMNEDICEFLVGRVKGEARRGKPLNDKRKFPSLKSLTVDNRRRLANFNKTHPSFSPTKSNLTFSGQLIDAVVCVFKNGINFLFIEDTSRKPYKTGPGSRQKNPPNNSELQDLLKKINKNFDVMTAKGIRSEKKIGKRIKSIVLKTLRRSLKK